MTSTEVDLSTPPTSTTFPRISDSRCARQLLQGASDDSITFLEGLRESLQLRAARIALQIPNSVAPGYDLAAQLQRLKANRRVTVAAQIRGDQVAFGSPMTPLDLRYTKPLRDVAVSELVPTACPAMISMWQKKGRTCIALVTDEALGVTSWNRLVALLYKRHRQLAIIDDTLLQMRLQRPGRYPVSVHFGSRTHHSVRARSFHSLWIRTSPVFEVSQGLLVYVFSPAATAPFRFDAIPVRRIISDEKAASLITDGELSAGAYCDDRGSRISGIDLDIARAAFKQVRQGVSILPSAAESLVMPRPPRLPGTSTDPRVQSRTWPQRYLAGLSPDRIVPGELLGSGNSYKAYRFGTITIVEFDAIDHATYVFHSDYFNSLRNWTRNAIRDSHPPGFVGAFHHDESARHAWCSRISSIIKNPPARARSGRAR